jgi:O-antigen/teichoic acid export membrane protein
LEFQGDYTLLLTTITICTLVTGLDFYVYGNRFLIKNREKAGFTLGNQFVFHLLSYFILIILFFSLRATGITHQYLTVTILFIIVFEHLGMEFFRTYIAIEKVFMANILLFVRTGLWPLLLIYQLVYTNIEVTLQSVVNYWILAGILSVLIGFIFIFKIIRDEKFTLDRRWIIKGVKIGGLFFVATIAQKIVEFSDRYIIDAFLGTKTLGIYSFYFQIANVVNVVIFTIFISFMYPKIIYFIDKREKKNALEVIRKLKLYTIAVIAGYTLLVWFLLPYLLAFVNRPELNDYQVVLYFFLAGNLFLNLSFTSHYALMAVEKDKLLMWIAIIIAIINLIGNLIAVKYFGIIGAVCVFAFSSISFYLVKRYAEKSFFKKYEW